MVARASSFVIMSMYGKRGEQVHGESDTLYIDSVCICVCVFRLIPPACAPSSNGRGSVYARLLAYWARANFPSLRSCKPARILGSGFCVPPLVF